MTTPSETALSAEDITNVLEVLERQERLGHTMTLMPTDVLRRLLDAARSPEHSCANHDESLDDAYRKGLADAARSQPATEACRIEPAFSQHEYAVDYCDTHDQPADLCARSQPATEGLRERIDALTSPARYENDRNGNWWTTDMEYGWDEAIAAVLADLTAARPAGDERT